MPLKSRLWLVGNSRYDTIANADFDKLAQLWLVGNSRYDTINKQAAEKELGYGLSGIHAMIQ